MEFLRYLEGMRTPALTAFFSLITYCGDELFFMVLAVTVFWCFSKRNGYYLLLVGFFGTILNQFGKLWFRIPRPWILDPHFTVVENARAAAGGYSFPSGHTQNIVGTMTCVLFLTREITPNLSHSHTSGKKRLVQIIAVALMLLVPFSRMYLGCHTPLDVGVSFLLAIFLASAFYPVIKKSEENPVWLWLLFLSAFLAAVFYWSFVTFYQFPADIDTANLQEGIKNAWTLLGCLAGLSAAKALDDRYLHFRVQAVWWAQILKVFMGLFFLLVIKSGLKVPLGTVLPAFPANAVRYFLMVFFAGAIWPMTFRWFSRLGKKTA